MAMEMATVVAVEARRHLQTRIARDVTARDTGKAIPTPVNPYCANAARQLEIHERGNLYWWRSQRSYHAEIREEASPLAASALRSHRARESQNRRNRRQERGNRPLLPVLSVSKPAQAARPGNKFTDSGNLPKPKEIANV